MARRSDSHDDSMRATGGNDMLTSDGAYVHMLPTPQSTSAVSRRSKRTARASARPQQRQQNQRQHIGHVHVVTWKERAQNFLDGPGGVTLETFNVLLSIVLVVISVIESYEDTDVAIVPGYNAFELVCTGIFTIDFILHLYAAEERWKFVRSPMAMIDIVTIAPTYIVLFLRSLDVSFLPIVRVIRVFRMLAVLRLYRIVQGYRGFEYELGVLVFIIFTVIIVAAGIFQILDENYYLDNGLPKLEFHQAVYFVFVTMSTVGYGDISPKTTASQLFVIVIICVVVTVIPRQIQSLVELSRLQHDYMHSYSVRKSGISNGGHVIVTGSISYESVSSFLSEFYRPGQGKVNMDVVILSEQLPNEKLLSVLRNVRYRRRTTFLKGSLLNDKDAKRVHVESAAAVFILADKKKVKHADAADALTILHALAVDKFKFRNQTAMVKRRNGGSIRCFLQILSPQRTRGLRTITGVEVALNTPRLRTAILARSILCPGATALVLNLVCSLNEEYVAKALSSNVPWIAEYSHGLQHQLYPVILPQFFDGMKYERAVQKLHTHFNVILVAVYDKFASQTGEKRIRLCPFGHILRENDLAFCIALSASDAQHAANSIFDVTAHEASRRHQANSLQTSGKDVKQWGSPPTLVFSSDTVLDRQSMVRERAPSIELLSDDESIATDLDVAAYTDQCEDLGNEEGELEATPSPLRPLSSVEFHQGASSQPLLRTPTPPLLPPFLQHHHSIGGGITDWTLPAPVLRKLHDHVIICGPFVHGHQLACYLDDLYHNELINEQRPTILLLVKSLPTELDFQNLPSPLPDNVFVEKGVSQNVEDLLHVRAYVARAVLMIPGNWKYHVDELRDETADEVNEHLLDYQVIMSTLSLRTAQSLHREHLKSHRASQHSMRPGELHRHHSSYPQARQTPTISCSVVKWHESIAYFAHKSHTSNSGHFFSETDDGDLTNSAVRSLGSWFHKNSGGTHQSSMDPQQRMAMMASGVAQERMLAEFPKGPSPLFSPSYAAGEVFVDGVLDTLLCQSFFNPYVIDLVRAIAGDYYYSEHHSHSTPQNFMSSMMEYFEAPATDTSDATRTTPSKPNRDAQSERTVQHPVLTSAKISRDLEGQSFASIFARALQQEILVLAIYRRPNDPRRGNALPYMFTCPKSSPEITVERGDTLHVLTKHVQPVCIH